MTDGQNNSGKLEPLMAAEAAQALGMKVYTIGIGKQGKAPMPVATIFRPARFIRWCRWTWMRIRCKKSPT